MAVQAKGNFAGFERENDALDAVVKRLVSKLDPQAIWLFGSRAHGVARPDSDFDLLVVAKAGSFNSEDYDLVDEAVRDVRVGCDLVPCGAEDFEEGKALQTSFVNEVLRHGRAVYLADGK